MSTLHVLIVGAGLGGLTLAQSLRRQGIGVSVFERDRSPWDRPQGYRLHLDSDAIDAAREVLPDGLHAVFEATSQPTAPYTTILGTDLSVVRRLPAGPGAHANVDRATLRQILLAGLQDAVRYGKALELYESTPEGVSLYFTDGTRAHGDVLVGADGIRSAVRRQRAPELRTMDAGVTAVYGRVPMAAALPLVPAETLQDIFSIASDERKVFLGLGAVRFPVRPAEAVARYAPGMTMQDQQDYVVCIVGGRPEYLPELSADLRTAAAEALQGWPDAAAAVVRAGDTTSFFLAEMRTSVPGPLGPPTNVTLLGDAIHAMTPTLGRGANVAMRDGARLGRTLAAVADGTIGLAEALDGYEREMLEYGFGVVREAARIGQQRMAQHPLP